MASSQLEIVSSSPFGCVLRDQNRKERCRDSNVRSVQSVFDKNFNDLVRDHINDVASWVSSEQVNADATANPHSLRFSNKNHHHHHHNTKNDVPTASTTIPRPPPVLDRWFTRHSQDVALSTSDKHVNEAAEPLLASNTAAPTTPMPTKTPHNSPAQSDNASAKNNHGASSLVQKWEAWLQRSNSLNSNQNQSPSMDSNTSRTSSGVSLNENNAVEQPSTRGPVDEKLVNRTNNADSLIDWEPQSDRTAAGKAVCSSCSRTAGVTDKVSIVDIIKKLKNDADDHEHSNNEHKHCSTADQAEQRCFSLATNVPRLRWRHAVHDLLIHREQDKNRELDSLAKRQTVSKFPQRGRIQAMLKIRSLQRFQIIQDRCRPQLPDYLDRFQQPSNIRHRRAKSSTGIDPFTTPQNVSATPRCPHKDKKSTGNGKPQEREDTHFQKRDQSSWQVNRLTTNKNEDSHERAKPLSDAIQQKTRFTEAQEIAKATTPLECQLENEVANKQGSNNQQHLFLGSQETAETVTPNEVAKVEQEKDEHHLSLGSQETAETLTTLNSSVENEIGEEEGNDTEQHLGLDSQSQDIEERSSAASYNNDSIENEIGEEEGNGNEQPLGLDSRSSAYYNNDINENEVAEEEEDYYQQYFDETNDYDWFSNISRPKSYWESLRKAWYQEVLTTALKNGDIRELVERGRISTLLGSNFRERMNRLMSCRAQIQADGGQCQQDVPEVEGKEEAVQPMCCPQINMHPAGEQEEEEEEEVYDDDDYDADEDEEERSLSSHQCHEANNYFDHSSSSLQMPSLSALVMRSWNSQDDNQTGNDYERRESAFSPPPQPSPQAQCYQDAIQSSSATNRPSLEIELICDLRRHIEQLHLEMSELRKSIVTCTEMQMKMQQYSFNRKVHSVEEEAKNAEDTIPWKRTCCICHEKQVDSLLYRCGHMCTCLKCGNELQWGSGKCPVCRAPILDVVPAK
ncbi:hypothetical protein HRI_003731000 [Hibiscus trionum]|uniref:RING-type domain-containing protein n=1 Tax=Hibiscus trionum TaxID=183268 RepID=A0A9W7ISS0_HIBTR|nr:hypothetical protein HRI_003731000 [Hibiscus trionum]